jgi:hypothetical protein
MSKINITLEEFLEMYQDSIGHGINSQCAFDLVNRARAVAYPMGDWVGTMVYRVVSVNANCFILPYDLEVIRSAKVNLGYHLTINSVVDRRAYCDCDECVLTRVDGRIYNPFQLTGRAPYHVFAVNSNDKGKKVRIQYTSLAGSAHDETIELNHTKNKSTRLRHVPFQINRIEKESTVGLVGISQGSTVAYLYPHDKSPTYTLYWTNVNSGCVAINAKRRYIPYGRQDLGAIIDIHPEALSTLIIALKAKDRKDPGWAQEHADAVKLSKDFLTVELSDETTQNKAMTPVETEDHFINSLHQP